MLSFLIAQQMAGSPSNRGSILYVFFSYKACAWLYLHEVELTLVFGYKNDQYNVKLMYFELNEFA